MVWLLEFHSRLKNLSIKSINVKNLVNIDFFRQISSTIVLSTTFSMMDFDGHVASWIKEYQEAYEKRKSLEILLFPQSRLNKYFSIRGISCYQLALFLVLLLKPLMILSMRPAGMRTSLGRNLQQLSGRFSWIS